METITFGKSTGPVEIYSLPRKRKEGDAGLPSPEKHFKKAGRWMLNRRGIGIPRHRSGTELTVHEKKRHSTRICVLNWIVTIAGNTEGAPWCKFAGLGRRGPDVKNKPNKRREKACKKKDCCVGGTWLAISSCARKLKKAGKKKHVTRQGGLMWGCWGTRGLKKKKSCRGRGKKFPNKSRNASHEDRQRSGRGKASKRKTPRCQRRQGRSKRKGGQKVGWGEAQGKGGNVFKKPTYICKRGKKREM